MKPADKNTFIKELFELIGSLILLYICIISGLVLNDYINASPGVFIRHA